MWRTSSTYVWKKFREQPQYRAYYEPLHELLAKPREQVLSIGHERRSADLRHPPINRSYFAEFPFAAGAGVPFFEKALSYERYCLQENDKDEPLHRYIANLLAFAGRKKTAARAAIQSQPIALRLAHAQILAGKYSRSSRFGKRLEIHAFFQGRRIRGRLLRSSRTK